MEKMKGLDMSLGINVETMTEILRQYDVTFFTGVPDSRLKPLCNYLISNYGVSDKHIIAANEGNSVAIAAGYHLATGKIPVVYMQNSGIGNTINPITSLLNESVYGIPCVFIIGWRGEPGIKDEPQHIFQGKVTLELLELMNINYIILDKKSTEKSLAEKMYEFKSMLDVGKSVAFVVKDGALIYNDKVQYKNNYSISREKIINHITNAAKGDVIVSTTGKTSRELFEIREYNKEPHKYDFLTVGSMGHSSSIALGIALNRKKTRIWCIDGDGAALMHMGAMAVIGSNSPSNFVHVVINNGAHESVGGMPTVANDIDFKQVALGCGYKHAYSISEIDKMDDVLLKIKNQEGPIFIEIKSAIGSRKDLGRPTTTPQDNKKAFMEYLRGLK